MNKGKLNLDFGPFYETEVPEGELIVSRTDLNGIITYANETFAEISGYSPQELIGQPHNIVRHPDMPASVFNELWETVRQEKSWNGYVKNRRKDGGYYWVHAEVSGVYKEGILCEFKSIRTPVGHDVKVKMQERYDKLLFEEEGIRRVALYLDKATIEKIGSLASAEGVSETEILQRSVEAL